VVADLAVNVNGLKLPNPFIIGSGPPGTNANVIGKAFDEGWGAVIAKTISLDASKVINVAPRYARLRASDGEEVWGWENIELISDRPFETWISEFTLLKKKYPSPGNILIASIMEEYRKEAWIEIVERCDATGIDAFELNFSCPHGLPERRMGSAMGQDPEILEEVCGWVRSATARPVWAKMTPNITHIEAPGRAALRGLMSGSTSTGAAAAGLSAINTILCVMGVNLDTLRPEPTVEGYTTPGGYSCKAVRPIALRMVMECAQMIRREFAGISGAGVPPARCAAQPTRTGGTPVPPDAGVNQGKLPSLSGIGGIETGEDAAQFILLGANTVQVCTGVMIHGYALIHDLCAGLAAFMRKHGFRSIEEFRGKSLDYFTTHADLVARQAAAKKASRERVAASSASGAGGGGKPDGVVKKDADWSGEKFVEQTDKLVANQ
jgi:dihydropyrimidine dehydrogenase (NADP+)/dihydropyrimidine dehydrogenase (NAD+) subunit PreA